MLHISEYLTLKEWITFIYTYKITIHSLLLWLLPSLRWLSLQSASGPAPALAVTPGEGSRFRPVLPFQERHSKVLFYVSIKGAFELVQSVSLDNAYPVLHGRLFRESSRTPSVPS
uniref:Uncharacterized protein n=1 Tax=Sphaerodactylus townsendi TaxID=933632 RepID=A0ACB8G066_9SAUR